jgi:hypothetical protein
MQTLTPKQDETILNKARYKVLNWGRRSGKTTYFAYEALGTALSFDKSQTTYYAQSFGDARDIAWDIFLDIFGEAIKHKNQSLLEITLHNVHGGESYVNLKGWESVANAGKGRGTENDLLLMDEVAFCKQFLRHYEKVLEPTLLTRRGRAVFGSTPDGFNDFYELAQRAQLNEDGSWFYSHATSYDNPNNPADDLDKLRKSKPEDVWAQEYLADFRKRQGLVYKDFNRNTHLFNTPPREFSEIIAGVDFGFVAPAAVLTIMRDRNRTYWITDELYKTGLTDDALAEYVAARKYAKVYPDPAQPQSIQVMKNKGVNVREVIKGAGSVDAGIRKLSEMFKQNRIRVHASCKNLILELETYAYDPDSPNDETPIDDYNHALDALSYALRMNDNERGDISLNERMQMLMTERDMSTTRSE